MVALEMQERRKSKTKVKLPEDALDLLIPPSEGDFENFDENAEDFEMEDVEKEQEEEQEFITDM